VVAARANHATSSTSFLPDSSHPTSSYPTSSWAMPKAVAARKANTIRVPTHPSLKIRTTNRSRTQKGRATSTHVNTTLTILERDPTPLSSDLPDLYPENPLSDDEEETFSTVRKGPSKAVSVSSSSPVRLDTCWISTNRRSWQSGSPGGRTILTSFCARTDLTVVPWCAWLARVPETSGVWIAAGKISSAMYAC
jgi:hypothetical protein